MASSPCFTQAAAVQYMRPLDLDFLRALASDTQRGMMRMTEAIQFPTFVRVELRRRGWVSCTEDGYQLLMAGKTALNAYISTTRSE